MKPGFQNVRTVKQWLDGIADLVRDRCIAEWRGNIDTALYLYHQPSKPGTFGALTMVRQGEQPPAGFELSDPERFHGFLSRDQIWQKARNALRRLPILDPSDLDRAPPAPALTVTGAAQDVIAAMLTPDPTQQQAALEF